MIAAFVSVALDSYFYGKVSVVRLKLIDELCEFGDTIGYDLLVGQ